MASPGLADDALLSKFPPTVVVTAEHDYLAHEAEEFANRLKETKVSVDYRMFEDVAHGERLPFCLVTKAEWYGAGFDSVPSRDLVQRQKNDTAREEAWKLLRDLFARELRTSL